MRAEDANHLKREVQILQSTTERVGIRELLEAGVHFGHQAKRWNPKMKRFIFAQRAGVHIIDLDQTLTLLGRAVDFARGVAEANREVLFVGTKKQAQIPLAEEALRSGQPFVAERYIGGMLTNFQTILPRIQYFKDLAVKVDETPEEEKTGKDWFALNRLNLFGCEEGAWVNIGLPRLGRIWGSLRLLRLDRCSRFGPAYESDSQQPTG